MQQTAISWSKVILTGIAFGIPAAIANFYLSFTLYGNVALYMGQFFVILCLVWRGLAPAIVAALISCTALYIYTDNYSFYILLILELLALYWLFRKGIVLLLGDLIYWLLLGGPIALFYLSQALVLPTDFLLLVYVKLLLNGLLYTSLAVCVLTFIPKQWLRLQLSSASRRLSGRIFYFSMICAVIPSLLIGLIFTARMTDQIENHIKSDLMTKSERINLATQDFVEHYQSALASLARSFEQVQTDSARQELVRTIYENYPGFITMLYTDAEGMLQFGHPDSVFTVIEDVPHDERSVADRDYFAIPKSTGQRSYVSPAFKGRGFGEHPIVAVSSPWYLSGEFQGVVEASLDLYQFAEFADRIDLDDSSQFVVITDANQDIIFASPELNLEPLSEYDPLPRLNVYTGELPLTRQSGQDFLFAYHVNELGWRTYVLSSPSTITALFTSNMIILLTGLLAVGVLFLVIAQRFAKNITRPLEALSLQLGKRPDEVVEPKTEDMTDEVQVIAFQLMEARNLMVSFNQELKTQVEEKTRALEAMNVKLEQLAREDGLTQLLNRRSFDEQAKKVYLNCQRHKIPVTMLLMDIDYFKSINDNFGHPVGDRCIIGVANLLKQHFKRDSDLVARYGGEEFAVLLTGQTDNLNDRIDQFRKELKSCCRIDDRIIPMTVSIGCISVQNDFELAYLQLISRADQLLYMSKNAGRDQIQFDII
ncbi:hypothetical protein IDSA_11425 [Pseudidiomarina salinarum]|uniref:diguanylate cyclase n=1 Tax=Pseudidiomarina salinarum TaxID=435908 RepID=A0A094IR55_9GAMM|nr:diguanylate cyclase [Pseudidiomarina salinarum]KFZ30165.1 hypothetical protein IDSA_11425 [Pseudidiomarina salinarum]RUO68666.1 GGDEF domain-containing protein [Pseudidiomarina salinarum]